MDRNYCKVEVHIVRNYTSNSISYVALRYLFPRPRHSGQSDVTPRRGQRKVPLWMGGLRWTSHFHPSQCRCLKLALTHTFWKLESNLSVTVALTLSSILSAVTSYVCCPFTLLQPVAAFVHWMLRGLIQQEVVSQELLFRPVQTSAVVDTCSKFSRLMIVLIVLLRNVLLILLRMLRKLGDSTVVTGNLSSTSAATSPPYLNLCRCMLLKTKPRLLRWC